MRLKRTIVRGIFLPSDHTFWVEQGAHWPGSDLVDNAWFEIDIERARDILARARLREEGRMAYVLFASVSFYASIKL